MIFSHISASLCGIRGIKKFKPDLTCFMMLYCQDKSRECILCNSFLAWFITFEYLDSKCLGPHLSSSLSLAYVIGYNKN